MLFRSGPIPDNEKGWKDVILIPGKSQGGGNGVVRVIKPFLNFADSINPYMYHCHILEHEDRGMMGQYVVIDTTSISINKPINSNSKINVFPNPITDQNFQIEISSLSVDEYTISLINPNGQFTKTVYQKIPIGIGSHVFSINLEEIPQGFYMLSFRSKQNTLMKRLIIY